MSERVGNKEKGNDCCRENVSELQSYILSLPELQKLLGREEMNQNIPSWASSLEFILNISSVKYSLQYIG